MGKSVYIRRRELYDKWSEMYKINIFGMSFDDFSRLREEETKYYKHWLFYDKLLKKMEVVNRGKQKKTCYKKANCTYKRSKTTATI